MLTKEFRVVHMPYCLQKLKDGRYVVLNRNYKPLGFMTNKHVAYEDYPIAVKFKGMTRKLAAKLSCDGKEDIENIFLYSDGCIPTRSTKNMTAYLDRLQLLARLKIS